MTESRSDSTSITIDEIYGSIKQKEETLKGFNIKMSTYTQIIYQIIFGKSIISKYYIKPTDKNYFST